MINLSKILTAAVILTVTLGSATLTVPVYQEVEAQDCQIQNHKEKCVFDGDECKIWYEQDGEVRKADCKKD